MSSKRTPVTSTKQKKVSHTWIDAVESININDEHWRCKATMIVETLPEHEQCVNLLNEAANKGARRAIYPLSYQNMCQYVETMSKIDQDKCPPAQTVFHHANNLMSRGESLEATLIAGLLKYLVHLAKIETITRIKQKSDSENDVDRQLRAMLTVTKAESQRSMKSMKSKKSDERPESRITEKANTNLRKRGEEWKDQVFIDDAPEDGPDLFILLTGFRDPDLPLELIKAGVPLNCVLKIRSKQTSESVDNCDFDVVGDDNGISGNSNVTQPLLNNFWSILDQSSNDPENLEYYSGVVFQTFCPPEIGIDQMADREVLQRDLYDRVSWIVYDICDHERLHADYIRSMKVHNVPNESRGELDIYTKIMDSLPAECCLVTVILQAMLTQVENDLQQGRISNVDEAIRSARNRTLSDEITKTKLEGNPEHRKSFSSPVQLDESNPADSKNHRQRLHDLNLQYGLEYENPKKSGQMENSEIILTNDKLRLKTYHVRMKDDIIEIIKPRPSSLCDMAARSLRDTRILDLWMHHEEMTEETRNKYRCHINKLTRCFTDQMDFRRLVHYLHLQVFDKMINGGLNRSATRGEDRRVAIMEKGAIPSSTRSDPFLLSSKILRDDRISASEENPISNLRRFASDGIIDYDKSVGVTFECPELFYLTDAREILQPGFLETREGKVSRIGANDVSDFTDVRLHSRDAFLQAINECHEEFEGFESEYLASTDSILLRFDHACDSPVSTTHPEDKVSRYGHRYHRVSRIVTPVCLRNFCEYVIREEEEWIRKVETERAGKRSMSAGELTRKFSHHGDIDVGKMSTFTDDDFILPNSLKGQARRKEENKVSTAADLAPVKSSKSVYKAEEEGKKKRETSAVIKIKKDKSKKEIVVDRIVEDVSLSSAAQSVKSSHCGRDGKPCEFIGYDLGNSRIQITNERETFVTSDEVVINIDIDQWLYRRKRLGIGISFANCFLKLENIINIRDVENLPFHLITENGIVMAFCRSEQPGVNQSSDIRIDFRASWPSGLSVEPVIGDSSENPFYIIQKYISKGPKCESVSREIYRKFLRNGTVLKFYDDGTVEVLRPNGTIVRCVNFEMTARARDSEMEPDGNLTKEDTSKSMKSRSSISTRGKRKTSSPRKRNSIPKSADHMIGETHSSRERTDRVKITRYNTIEHDGRFYETLNDEVSQVFEEFLVGTIADSEVGEIFARREDGTRWLLNCNGDLIVSYPDGTRITSGFSIEDEPLICDWDDDEFDQFFTNTSTSEGISSQFGNVSRTGSKRSSTRRSTARSDKAKILLADAFVSVLMTCRIEHQCYATVAYDQTKKSCVLSMPDDVFVTMSSDGTFDLTVGTNSELRITENNLTLSSKTNENNPRNSETIYNFHQPELNGGNSSKILLVTNDSDGNVFTVHEDGSVIRNEDSGKSSTKSSCKHCRLFAMNRDLTAYEYLHKSQRNTFEEKSSSNVRSCVITIPNGRAPGLEYRLFLNPPDPLNYSEMWLQKFTEVRQTNKDRTDLSRSTYSNPYEWIFPFGRNGNGVRKNTWKVPLGETVDESRPGVLALTFFQGIAMEGKNLLIELQKALGSYWRSMIDKKGAYTVCDLFLEDLSTSSEAKIDTWVTNLALGIERSIDVRKYLSGVQTNRIRLASSKLRRLPIRAKFSKPNSSVREKTRRYEESLEEEINLPYFKSIRGACFLWIMSCADEAVEYVEKY